MIEEFGGRSDNLPVLCSAGRKINRGTQSSPRTETFVLARGQEVAKIMKMKLKFRM
jgi:hypothetical protein